ncbi:MAG: hypothetical protein PHT07_15575 [Paludibacter sp.]|nr:hypothetical protein [Paludibacter sp.]
MRKLTEHQFHTIWTEAVGREGYNKKLFQNLLEALRDKGLIYERKKPELSKEFIQISFHMLIDGSFKNGYKKTYERGRETEAFTLDSFARILFMYEHLFDPHCTYAYDRLLQEAEKKLPKKGDETAKSVFEKYWVNLNKTIDDEFQELNKGNADEKYPLFPEQNDFLKLSIVNIVNAFIRAPLPVKYGFLHWFYKYKENGSIDEIRSDFDKIPDEIKKIVDDMVEESKEKQTDKN